MTTTSWQTRKYVPDSDDDEDEDLAVPGDERWVAFGTHATELHDQQKKPNGPLTSSQATNIQDEQEERRTEYGVYSLQSSQVIVLKSQGILRKADHQIETTRTSANPNDVGSQKSGGYDIEHPEGYKIHRASSPPRDDDLFSISSSPLSAISASTPSLSPRSAQLQDVENPELPVQHLDFRTISDDSVQQEYRPARELRARRAIQLNPYAVEGQMYKQVWRSRGLVPLQVKTHSQPADIHEIQHSSSQLEYQSESSDDAGNHQELGPSYETEQSATTLPDLDNESVSLRPASGLLAEPMRDMTTKRRKLTHIYSRREQLQSANSVNTGFHVREDGWIEVPFAQDETRLPVLRAGEKSFTGGGRQKSTSGNSPGLMTPSSGPRSSNVSSPDLSRERGLSVYSAASDEDIAPKQLYTPITSSEARPNHGRRLVKKLDLHRSPQQRASADIDDFVLNVSSASEIEDEASGVIRQIATAQKRTKGVLPASWHRLEYQKLLDGRATTVHKPPLQSSRPRPHIASPSLKTRKGVARRITSTHHRDVENNADTTFEALIDDESNDGQPKPNLPPAKIQQEINDFLTTDDHFPTSDDSNMEDNSIDAMTIRNSTSTSRKTYKRTTKQPKIRDYLPFRKGNVQSLVPKPSARIHDTSRKPARERSSMSKRQRHHVAGILDVSQRLRREDTPKFLAYAVRTAKQRVQAQHQPGKKRIRVPGTGHGKTQQRASNARETHLCSETTTRRLWRAPLRERSSNISHFQRPLGRDNARISAGQDGMQRQAQSFLTDSEEESNLAIETAVSKATLLTKRGGFLREGHPITSTTVPNRATAPAQLEAVNDNRQRQHSVPQGRRYILDTFLQRSANQSESTLATEIPLALKIPLQRQRKRLPKQVLIATTVDNNRTSSCEATATVSNYIEYCPVIPSVVSGSADLQIPVQAEFTTTFSTTRLPDGGHFHPSTLLGSRLFADSLETHVGHQSQAVFRPVVDGETLEWSGWNEVTAQQVFSICDKAISLATLSQQYSSLAVSENAIQQLRMVIRYLATSLRFLDPIDRRDFVLRWTTVLKRYENEISAALIAEMPEIQNNSLYFETTCLMAVIINQIRQIVQDDTIDRHLSKSIFDILARILRYSLQAVFRTGLKDFHSFAQDAVNLSNHVSRSKLSQKTEALVILFHLLQSLETPRQTFWDVLREQSCLVCPSQITFSALENAWHNMFSLLPILEIDPRGQAAQHVSSPSRVPNWKLVKQLIEPVFAAYTSSRHRSSTNQYCWTLYARCHRLLDYWGWHDCESIMGFLFDFFAQNQLHDLRMESNLGSPSILANLKSASKLEVRNLDRCFQVLLKIIGKGLKTMRMQRNDKRIGNCVWRLTPNHDRSLPKDQSLRQEDLDAVRNHLDLLGVLYWAAPPQYRIRIEVVQNLIDIGNSHREVCYLVIEKWHDLVVFQLSTQERSDKLDVFVQWYDEIVVKLARLYQLARTEVESDAKQAATLRGQHFTMDEQERIIQASQQNVQSVLQNAFMSLKSAITQVSTTENLQQILPSCFGAVFRLWNANQPRTNLIIAGSMDAIRAWLKRAQELETLTDSQDYGDWAAFDELEPEITKKMSLSLPESTRQVLQTFLVDLFGSELAVEDDILHDSMQCWLEIAEFDIRADNLIWDDLIDPYNPRSWNLLRDTTQTRTFTPLFLSSLLRKDPTLYERKKSMILQRWIACLLERESLIKYQPILTSTLFNQDVAEPLFQNQPFSRVHGNFDISLGDFLSKRVSLLACILSNMRESLSFSVYHQLQDSQARRKSYSELLRHLMDTLKSNFQSLDQESQLQGDYVTFAQEIVRLLQEHTADICKVDGFFLDAVNFPLPAEDPEYLVSKLKSLALQSQHNRGLQQLGAFVQSLFERAVIEGRQDYFARLIFSATEDVLETGSMEQPTLRSLICCQILPDYVDAATKTRCGWAIAETILLCVSHILQTVRSSINAFSPASLAAGQSIVSSVLNALCASTGSILNSQSNFDTKSTALLTRYFLIIESALTAWDSISYYVSRQSPSSSNHDLALSDFFAQSAIYTIAQVEDLDPHLSRPTAPAESNTGTLNLPFNTARVFTRDALFASLSETSSKCKWRFEGDKLFVRRNARWDAVKFVLGSSDERKWALVHAARSLLRKLQETPLFSWSVTRMVLDVPYSSALIGEEHKQIGGDSYFI